MHKQYVLLFTLILSASGPALAMNSEMLESACSTINRDALAMAHVFMQRGLEEHEIQEFVIKDMWADIHEIILSLDSNVQITENRSLKFHNHYALNIFHFITLKELKALAALRFATQNYEDVILQGLGRCLEPAPQKKDLIPTRCDRAEILGTVAQCERALKIGSWIIETVKCASGQAHTKTIAQALKHLEKIP